MSESNSAGDIVYDRQGQALFIGCGFGLAPQSACAYCNAESRWVCDAPGSGRFGRCGIRMCGGHTTRVNDLHDLCPGHAAEGRPEELLTEGDASHGAWWEIVETLAVPIGDPPPFPIRPTSSQHTSCDPLGIVDDARAVRGRPFVSQRPSDAEQPWSRASPCRLVRTRLESDQEPRNQLDVLHFFAKARNWIAHEFVDHGVSGTKERRPSLDALLAAVRSRRIDVLVCTKLDRLARSTHHLVTLAKELEALRVDLVVLDQAIDTTTPSGRLLFHVLAAISEFERDLIRDRVIAGIKTGAGAGATTRTTRALSRGCRACPGPDRSRILIAGRSAHTWCSSKRGQSRFTEDLSITRYLLLPLLSLLPLSRNADGPSYRVCQRNHGFTLQKGSRV